VILLNKLSKTTPYFISDKGLILETVKNFVSGTHERFRSIAGDFLK
jgi:hypothetical protein